MLSTDKDIKSSVKSADDRVQFKIDDFFVDDYQHYPAEFMRYITKYQIKMMITYSLSRLDKSWSEMIVEDKEVCIMLKKIESKKTNEKDEKMET
jgi:hypothetical protein